MEPAVRTGFIHVRMRPAELLLGRIRGPHVPSPALHPLCLLENCNVINDRRGRIDYDETDQAPSHAPTLVLVPGSCSTGAAWRPLMAHWKDRFRCITTSLLGYGGTAERRTADNADIALEAEIIEAVIARAAAPVHLIGHSFGGLAALAVALRRPHLLHSLTILETPAPEILRHAQEEAHYRAFRNMTTSYFAAFQTHQPNAIERMVDFYGGVGTFAGWPQRVRDYAVQTTAVNLLDWAGAYGFALTPSLLGKVVTPTLVIWGEKSHPAVKRANELLGQSIRKANVAAISGAAHFMIATHADDVAGLVARHLDQAMVQV
jgi:pimeloyl-ACP methyl ester carboxylesterase